jgi:hypothetical protein
MDAVADRCNFEVECVYDEDKITKLKSSPRWFELPLKSTAFYIFSKPDRFDWDTLNTETYNSLDLVPVIVKS